jgi:hypothetical protein
VCADREHATGITVRCHAPVSTSIRILYRTKIECHSPSSHIFQYQHMLYVILS